MAEGILDAVGAVVPEGPGGSRDGVRRGRCRRRSRSARVGRAHSAHPLMAVFSGRRTAAVAAVVRVRHVDSDLQGRRADHGAEGPRPDAVPNPAAFLGPRTGPLGNLLVGVAAMLAMRSAPRREPGKGIAWARARCR